MNNRPKPGDGEEDILRMQEEYFREKNKDQNLKPAAQVVNLRPQNNSAVKRASTSDQNVRKQSKYALSKGINTAGDKSPSCTLNCSVMGDIVEKNIKNEDDNDKVYFPKVIPTLLGEIIEKNVDNFAEFDLKPMPSEGFPAVTKCDTVKPSHSKSIFKSNIEKEKTPMDVDNSCITISSDIGTSSTSISEKSLNLLNKSFILSCDEADDIHTENIGILNKMSTNEIIEEQQKLFANLDPKLIDFLKSRRQQNSMSDITDLPSKQVETMGIQESEPTVTDSDFLWENDVFSNPNVCNWLHFDKLEKDKLEWMKGIEFSKRKKPDEPYEARFDFNGYLLPYTMEYNETTKSLFHHGAESDRPGYSLTELFELTRSSVLQQRVMALNTIAGILEYYSTGVYNGIIEIPLSKVYFVIRFALDENKVTIIEPALKALRNLIYNRIDEASLDALIEFEEGTHQPCLENDKSEIKDIDSQESELKDFHLAEIDLITAIIRTDILQRIYYVLETVKPSYYSVQYALQVLTRLSRDSVETALKILEKHYLVNCILNNFVPDTSINFNFDPSVVYNGKPILAALKLLRVLSAQSCEISQTLISKHNILQPLSAYVSSGIEGTYGLKIQIEAFSIFNNLITFKLGMEIIDSLAPVIITAMYKHVKGTDIYTTSCVTSVTHAAAVLQFINKRLQLNYIKRYDYKDQVYPLLKEGVQKWLTQLSSSAQYSSAHLRLLGSILDCWKTIVLIEGLQVNFLSILLKSLLSSRGFQKIVKNLIPSSNLLSGIDSKKLQKVKNLRGLSSSVIDSNQKVLPVLNAVSPIPFLASLFKLIQVMEDVNVTQMYVNLISTYLNCLVTCIPSLCDNWFTRIEINFVFTAVQLASQIESDESKKDLIYSAANKLCYILRSDKKEELEYLFSHFVFNKQWLTSERLLNLISLTDVDGFSKALNSIDKIKQCYIEVFNLRCEYVYIPRNIVLRNWQEPILPRDWIYLPILKLYSKSQEIEVTPKVTGVHAKKVSDLIAREKEIIIGCSLEWILFTEKCFPDLLDDIDLTDRLCRIMCIFLCDNALFLDKNIKILLRACTEMLFRKEKRLPFNFDQKLTGLNNFQDFYTLLLEQFQSVSYGDTTFAACVLVPLAQKHNIKWRKLLWSEYAGCLRALDCPENELCYEIKDYLVPEETDESLLKSYFRALSCNLVRPDTIAYKIASHHVEQFKRRTSK